MSLPRRLLGTMAIKDLNSAQCASIILFSANTINLHIVCIIRYLGNTIAII
jgi:hypothetical protein